MSDIGLKLGFAGTILVVGYTFSIAPKYAMKANKNLFSLGNMMASGVLLGAGLVHQLPDAEMMLFKAYYSSQSQQEGDEDEGRQQGYYPWGGFICGVTFSAFLILEECMHLFVGSHEENLPEGNDHHHQRQQHSRTNSTHHHHHHHHSHKRDSFLPESIKRENDKEYGTVEKPDYHHGDGGHDYHLHSIYHSQICLDQNVNDDSSTPQIIHPPSINICPQMSTDNNTSSSQQQQHNHEQHHHHNEHISKHLHGSITSSLILLLALTIHSILAGMGLGFHSSSLNATITTFIAIISHKMFAAYALGSTLTAAGEEIISSSRYFVMISIFAVSTPLGIVLALVVGSVGGGVGDVTIGGIKAAVAGTFLYISIVEVGMKELLVCRIQARHNGGGGVLGVGKQVEIAKLVSFIGGYAVMAILALHG